MLDKAKIEKVFELLKQAHLTVCYKHEEGGCSDVETIEELIGYLAPALGPEVGSIWQHSNHDVTNMLYTVVAITNVAHLDESHPPQVVYQGDNGNTWSAPLEGWPHKLVAWGAREC